MHSKVSAVIWFLSLWLCAAGVAGFAAESAAQQGMRYYIAGNGSDDKVGTTPEAAWKSLAKLNSIKLAPGDTLLLQRGSTWHERLIVKAQGTSAQPVTFTAYGEGARPVIDGTGIEVPLHQGLVQISGARHARIESLEVRNSTRDGIVAYDWKDLTLKDCITHHNQFCGVSAYQGERLLVANCEMHHNSLDAGQTGAYAGIRIFGTVDDAQITQCQVHHNQGGPKGWADVANGIYLGQDNFPTLRAIVIADNNIHDNGNFAQNQAGRGIQAAMRGDVLIERNTFADQSASGIFLTFAPDGEMSQAYMRHNTFLRNHLRAMGATGEASVEFVNNIAYASQTALPNHSYTGLAMLDKTTHWLVKNNIFFLDSDNATWRGFMVISNEMGAQAQIDHNLYYSSGPNKWMLRRAETGKAGMHYAETYPPLNWEQWRELGYDQHSIYSQNPLFIAPAQNDFRLAAKSPGVDAGTDVGLKTDVGGLPVPQGQAPDIGLHEQ